MNIPNPIQVTCDRCKEVHAPLPRCQAHAKSTGKQCSKPAIPGGTTCRRYHGGGAPQVQKAAARRLAQAWAQDMLDRMAIPIEVGDGEALVALRNQAAGVVDALRSLVGALGQDGLYGATFHATGRPTGESKPHVLMVMLGDWSDRLAKLDEACVRLGLAERHVRVEEAEVALLARAVDVMLAQVVPAELHARARAVLAAELRRLDEQAGMPGGKVA